MRLFWKVFAVLWLATLLVGGSGFLISRALQQDWLLLQFHPQLRDFSSQLVGVYEEQGPAAAQQWLEQQLQQYQATLEREQVNEKKTWLLEMRVDERTQELPAPPPLDDGTQPPAPPPRRYFRVELVVAKALPQGKQDFAVRDEIKAEFVGPLLARLSGAPFFIRDGEKNPPAYGEASVGTLTRLYGLNQTLMMEPPRGAFPCISVPIKFEVGIAQEQPKPAAPAEGDE